MFQDSLDEFDDSREVSESTIINVYSSIYTGSFAVCHTTHNTPLQVVASLIDEYRAAERPDYISWGLGGGGGGSNASAAAGAGAPAPPVDPAVAAGDLRAASSLLGQHHAQAIQQSQQPH